MQDGAVESSAVQAIVVERDFWSAYLSDEGDAEGFIAAALHLRAEHLRGRWANAVDIVDALPDARVVALHRLAAQGVLDSFSQRHMQDTAKLTAAKEAPFLLIRHELNELREALSLQLNASLEQRMLKILEQTSFSKQIIVSAMSGLLVGLFIVIGSMIPDLLSSLKDIAARLLEVVN